MVSFEVTRANMSSVHIELQGQICHRFIWIGFILSEQGVYVTGSYGVTRAKMSWINTE